MIKKSFIISFNIILFCSFSFAKNDLKQNSRLTFDTKTLKKELQEGKRSVDFTFNFKNNTQNIINIDDIKTPCSCTVAKLSKKTYNPGEEGELNGKISFSGQSGKKIYKSMTVKYSSGNLKLEDLLSVEIKIPNLYSLSHKTLIWNNKDTKEKIIKLSFHTNKPVKINNFKKNKYVNLSLKEIKKGREYQIIASPKLNSRFLSVISINTDHRSFQKINIISRFDEKKIK